ncbi:hypothetical protein [Winogradskya humida]|uniref:Stereocilin n=1 Tax=Winogradskya humida TaxID=113566 RepID=A0ABQ4A764_9ACTN|nr:hypothetical protein [Actinoplanes humidus]GIE26702.1 hypothetical protein Ahu01nite_098040 [Actinoplanes humidus]
MTAPDDPVLPGDPIEEEGQMPIIGETPTLPPYEPPDPPRPPVMPAGTAPAEEKT